MQLKINLLTISIFGAISLAHAQQFNCYQDHGAAVNISTVADIQQLASCVNSGYTESGVTFNLMNDIDFSGETQTVPIGTQSTPFDGTFTGLTSYHGIARYSRIKNLSINGTGDTSGLFGYVGANGVIQNLKLINLNQISNSTSNGGLVGVLNGGMVSNVFTSGSMYLTPEEPSMIAGGLVGKNINGTITHSATTININVLDSINPAIVGGLVGFQDRGEIDSSYASGSTTGQNYTMFLGGLVSIQNSGTIDSSYSTGSITITGGGYNYAGGLVAQVYGGTISNSYSQVNISLNGDDQSLWAASLICSLMPNINSIHIINSYATGAVNGDVASQGGLVAEIIPSNYPITCSNSYWNIQTTNQNTSLKCPTGGRNTTQMFESGTYESWDFNNIWGINEESGNGFPYGYPYLYSNHESYAI